jgi:hypothetical protein
MVVRLEGQGWIVSLIYVPQGSINPGDLIYDDTQIEWDGLLMGVDTYFGYKSLTGWDDLPASDSGDALRPHTHGEVAGSMWAQGRIISFDTQIWSQQVDFPVLRQEFMRRMQITQEEKTLTIRQHGETLMAFARVVNRSWPIDKRYFGGYPIATIQWKATDPRRYSLIEQSFDLHAPVNSGGLEWVAGGGLDWATGGGLDWGTIVSGASAIVNGGLSDTPIRFEFHGPLTGPYYVLAPGSFTLGFDLDLAVGETLMVDARLGTVTLAGVDRYYTLTLDSDIPEDCLALAGTTPVQFVPVIGDLGYVSIFWRDAQM